MPEEVIRTILAILKKGNNAEIKKENGKLVVVEIQRKVKVKTSIIGQRETAKRGYEQICLQSCFYLTQFIRKAGEDMQSEHFTNGKAIIQRNTTPTLKVTVFFDVALVKEIEFVFTKTYSEHAEILVHKKYTIIRKYFLTKGL